MQLRGRFFGTMQPYGWSLFVLSMLCPMSRASLETGKSCAVGLIQYDNQLLKRSKSSARRQRQPGASEDGELLPSDAVDSAAHYRPRTRPQNGEAESDADPVVTMSDTHHTKRIDDGKEVRDELKNHEDMFYTTTIKLGGQPMEVIPDTGSFDGVFFGSTCNSCGPSELLYNPKKSNSYQDVGIENVVEYGSGTLNNFAAFDTFEMADPSMKVDKQLFWMTTSAAMEVAGFAGVMGLGPPVSAVTFAKAAVDAAAGTKSSSWGSNASAAATAAYDLIKTNTQWLTSTKIKSLSFCLRRRPGDKGYFIYHDQSPSSNPGLFRSVVVTDEYWSTSLGHMKLDKMELGCKDNNNGKCTAVLDSGTSLLAVPSWVITKVNEFADGADCDDLSKLPDLEFSLDKKSFSLPPSAYMGKMKGTASAFTQLLMPRLKRHFDFMNDGGIVCSHLFMDIGFLEDNVYIFGLPFFRAFYTNFELDDTSTKANVMRIAANDDSGDSCMPSKTADLRGGARRKEDITPRVVDVSLIRPPSRYAQTKTVSFSQARSSF